MKVKNLITILFIFLCFSFSKAQENKIQKKRYNDIIEISKDIFYTRAQSKKYKERNAMYIGIGNNKKLYDYIIRQIDKGKLKQLFKRNPPLLNILFNKKELAFYKKQALEGKFKFNHCDIETDSIFVFNKNRDHLAYRGNRLRKISENNVESIFVPFFTKNNKYAFTQISNIQGGGYVVYEKKNGEWVEVFYFGHYIS